MKLWHCISHLHYPQCSCIFEMVHALTCSYHYQLLIYFKHCLQIHRKKVYNSSPSLSLDKDSLSSKISPIKQSVQTLKIFSWFRGSFKPRKLTSNKIQFSHWLLPVVFESTNWRTHGSMHFVETTNWRTHGSMHFVETTKIGVNK